MFIFRAIEKSDLKEFTELAFTAHAGITSLPKNKILLSARIETALESFQKEIWAPEYERYLFVLENDETKQIGGVSGIDCKSGVEAPHFYYRIIDEDISTDKLQNHSALPQKTLNLIGYKNGPTENVSLFLHPSQRKEGLGKLLSLSRLLFIASNRQRFNDIIIASLRGVIFDDVSPFWDGVGRHFFDVDFPTIEHIRQENQTFLENILPKHPIYISLLPKDVQKVIGIPHQNSLPAYNMLTKMNFEYAYEVDPFDGGPKISAYIDKIPFIHQSEVAIVSNLEKENIESATTIACNNRCRDFRAIFSRVTRLKDGTVTITEQCAKALKVEIGGIIRYSTIHQE